MTTTVVRDSIVGDAWIQQASAQVPVQRVIDPKTGQATGDILTGPVRLCYPFLDKLPQKRQGNTSDPKYGSNILFTPYSDMKIFTEEYYKWCGQHFPEYYDAASGQYYGLHSPFRDQGEKVRKGGYTPGCTFFNSTSQFKPPVVDSRGNHIVDFTKVYPGVWAICALRPYVFGKNPKQPKFGIAFGLQSVMLIGDDTKLGTAAPDASQHYHGVNVAAPIARPNIAGMPPGGAPAPAAGIPGYTMPGGGVAPGQPPFQQPPTVPYAAAPVGFAASPTPGSPPPHQSYAPPANLSMTQYPSETEEQRFAREMREMGVG